MENKDLQNETDKTKLMDAMSLFGDDAALKSVSSASETAEGDKAETSASETSEGVDASPSRSIDKTTIMMIIASIVAVVLLIVGVVTLMGDSSDSESNKDSKGSHPVNITVNAEGYDEETSSPIPVQIDGTGSDGNKVTTETLIGNGEKSINLPEGSYTICVSCSPFLEDGTMFDVSTSQTEFEVAGTSNTTDCHAEITIAQLDPSQVTEEMINASKNKLTSLGCKAEDIQKYCDAATSLMQANSSTQTTSTTTTGDAEGSGTTQSSTTSASMSDAKAEFQARYDQIQANAQNDPRFSTGGGMAMVQAAQEHYQNLEALIADMTAYLSGALTGDQLAYLQSSAADWEYSMSSQIDSYQAMIDEEAASGLGRSGFTIGLELASIHIENDISRVEELFAMMG